MVMEQLRAAKGKHPTMTLLTLPPLTLALLQPLTVSSTATVVRRLARRTAAVVLPGALAAIGIALPILVPGAGAVLHQVGLEPGQPAEPRILG